MESYPFILTFRCKDLVVFPLSPALRSSMPHLCGLSRFLGFLSGKRAGDDSIAFRGRMGAMIVDDGALARSGPRPGSGLPGPHLTLLGWQPQHPAGPAPGLVPRAAPSCGAGPPAPAWAAPLSLRTNRSPGSAHTQHWFQALIVCFMTQQLHLLAVMPQGLRTGLPLLGGDCIRSDVAGQPVKAIKTFCFPDYASSAD